MPYINPYVDGLFLGLLLTEYATTTLHRVMLSVEKPEDYSQGIKRAHMFIRYQSEMHMIVLPKSVRPHKPEAVCDLQARLLLDYKNGNLPERSKRIGFLTHRIFPKNNAKRAWLNSELTRIDTPEWCKPFTQDYGDYLAHLYREFAAMPIVTERLKRLAGIQNFYSADPLSGRVADCEEMLAAWMGDIPRYAKALLTLDFITTRRQIDDIYDVHSLMKALTHEGLLKTNKNVERSKRRKRNRHVQQEL